MHTVLFEQIAKSLALERQQRAAADNHAARLRAVRRWQRRQENAERHLRLLLR